MASTQSHNQSVNITKTVVDKTPLPASGQLILRDAALKGFGVRIMASGARAFILEKRIDGKVRRLTLGRFGEITCEQARKAALKVLGQLAIGHNPVAERERERMRGLTLEQVFADFSKARPLKERTLYDYGRLVEVAFAPWKTRPFVAITRATVVKLHQEMGEQRGEAYANLAMRFLRSLFNFAIAQYEDGAGRPLITENPVARLTQTRAWFHNERRQTVIKVWALAPWYAAVDALRAETLGDAETIADYLEFMLYTGLRRQEAARLRWDQVDLRDRTLRIADTKNRVPHVLPLPTSVLALLQRRQSMARNDFVFPGDGKAGHLIEPKRQIAKVVAASDVSFTLHDLRRTFITVAESLDIPPYAIKRLVNHKMRNDVTAGYIISDAERLRAPMQKISDYLDRATGRTESAPVIPLRANGS
jgi:integrase